MASTQTVFTNNRPSKPIATIIKAGLIAGTLDIVTALIMFYMKTHKDPMIVFKYIASAAFGKAAYSGASFIVAGIVFHYIIAFSFTILYFFLYPRIKFMHNYPVLAGLTYGICVWLIMNLLVLPLTQLPPITFNLQSAITGTIVLMLAIGLPVSLIVHNYFSRNKRMIENDVV
ncbi:hypothetical protein QTN47_00585 [Danxiaibacter flavus]|uniref:DUF1440 domain-containing protein n=1 Tax=Danxiaibacter flavus TaxID=3049108 RepID=A0ABV3ZA54_9BACT|nr:hypothetical protein QNM32_00585 [Chitinophagaceae bacterium DXS]